VFLVDLSASGAFGSTGMTKNELAAEFCALVSFAAAKNNDKVGLIVFTDDVEMYIPPKKGSSHVLRVIREILYFKPKQARTDIGVAIDYLGRVMKKRAVVFLVSDFLGAGYEGRVRILAKRHDLIAVSVSDPREIEMPDVGLIELEDAETGSPVVIDTSSTSVRRDYEGMGRERSSALKELLTSSGVDRIEIQTGKDYLMDLTRFFLAREKRR